MYKHMYMHCLHMKIFEFMTICAENLRIEMITVFFWTQFGANPNFLKISQNCLKNFPIQNFEEKKL